jgi:hypothetical protein
VADPERLNVIRARVYTHNSRVARHFVQGRVCLAGDAAHITPPWIGQERAEIAAHFGLGMDQADYNLFVLGEVGSGRSSLLKQAMQTGAALRATPPDLCYLHNFDAPEHPQSRPLQSPDTGHCWLKPAQSPQDYPVQAMARRGWARG